MKAPTDRSSRELSVGQALGLRRPLRPPPQINTHINSGAESPAQAEGLPHKVNNAKVRDMGLHPPARWLQEPVLQAEEPAEKILSDLKSHRLKPVPPSGINGLHLRVAQVLACDERSFSASCRACATWFFRSLLALALAAFLLEPIWGASDTTYLIRGADVYPVVGAMMPATSILIEDGKIAEIGPKIAAPTGAKIIEAKGLRVYPGMIDSCTQIGLSEIPSERATVDTNELGEFMPQLRALSAINPASEHIAVSRANGITSVMSFPSTDNGRRPGGGTQILAGQAALIHLDGWTWQEMAIRGDAALQLIFPEMPAVSPGGRRGAPATIEEARQQYHNKIAELDRFFDAARQYRKERAANAPGFKRNLKMEAMIPVLETKVRVAVFADRERSTRDAIDFARRQHIDIAIMEPRELRKVLPELRLYNIPVIFGRTEELPQNDDSPYDEAESLPAEAAKAGVKFAFSTGDNEFVRDLPYNAARAVAYGLPYDEALKALTINAAQIWGVADRIGSIKKGKWADLMVTNGDPLETPTQVEYLFINGKQVDLSNRQTRLYDKYLKRSQ